ncbi:MAG: hypothetical protein LBW85_03930 [Deltaproteobacteria bacterium]|jgi:hypothetical protein|nr:hypothetical protein [Deltaproteobacteria bacterium]
MTADGPRNRLPEPEPPPCPPGGKDPPPAGRKDWEIFLRLTSTELSDSEREAAARPDLTDPGEEICFAPHFHPEWVPLELIGERLARAFPGAARRFAVPTQHNVLASMEGWCGVEADVWSSKCGMKLQLLVHMKADRLEGASAFRAMIERTFRYREFQLLDILELAQRPDRETGLKIAKAGFKPAESEAVGRFAATLKGMIDESGVASGPGAVMLKNRLVTDFVECRAGGPAAFSCRGPAAAGPAGAAERVIALFNLLKSVVKSRLEPARFCEAAELVEEARSLGAGIVIPHPPRFWPALLEDLDVDGWEVWNPSTPDHAVFLVECLSRRGGAKRPLLAFMGDDTHMSSKIRLHMVSDKGGGDREIGFQPPWRDPAVTAALKAAGQSRLRTLDEYLERLA